MLQPLGQLTILLRLMITVPLLVQLWERKRVLALRPRVRLLMLQLVPALELPRRVTASQIFPVAVVAVPLLDVVMLESELMLVMAVEPELALGHG